MNQKKMVELPKSLYLPVIKDQEGNVVGYGQPGEYEFALVNVSAMERNDLLVGQSVSLVEYKL